jgi:DNA topoisomerase-2
MLNPLTRFIFPEVDDMVLTYLDDDGTIVEPDFYVPIIPFALLNGISGIGTGFSCSIAPYNPTTIIRYLKAKLTNADCSAIDFVPYYEGFAGTVRRIADQKYLVKGVYEKIAEDKIRITELPVGTWTMPYTSYLETLVDGALNAKTGKKSPPLIKDFTSVSTEVAVDFVVVFGRGQLAELESSIDDNECNGVEKLLKLTTTVSTTNMHMFNSECKLHKYADVNEIIDDFYGVRIGLYKKRKDCLIVDMEKRLVRLSNRAKYIQETLNGTIDLRRKTAQVVNDMLTEKGYVMIDGDFKYLVKMPMDSVTEENVASIMKEKEATETELSVLRKTSLEKMWLSELDSLEKEYTKYKAKREKIQAGDPTKKVSAGGAKVVVKRKTK